MACVEIEVEFDALDSMGEICRETVVLKIERDSWNTLQRNGLVAMELFRYLDATYKELPCS